MATGAYFIDKHELDEFADALQQTAGNIKDLTKVYRAIGKKAGEYVKAHEPLPSYDHSKNSASHLPDGYMQSRTRGGGGKGGAWVTIDKVPYLMLQEFGGASKWYRGAQAVYVQTVIGKSKRGHDITRTRKYARGHVIYTKPRRRMGYFIWNVAYRLRSVIGEDLCRGLQVIANEYGIYMDVFSSGLDIEQEPGPTG